MKCSFLKFRRKMQQDIPENDPLKQFISKCVGFHVDKNISNYRIKKSIVERTLEVSNPTASPKVRIIFVCIIPDRAPENSSL